VNPKEPIQPSAPVSASQPSDEEVVKQAHPDAIAEQLSFYNNYLIQIGNYRRSIISGFFSTEAAAWKDARSKLPKAAEPSAPTITARQLIDELWAEYHEDGPFTHKGLESVLKILESEASNVGQK